MTQVGVASWFLRKARSVLATDFRFDVTVGGFDVVPSFAQAGFGVVPRVARRVPEIVELVAAA